MRERKEERERERERGGRESKKSKTLSVQTYSDCSAVRDPEVRARSKRTLKTNNVCTVCTVKPDLETTCVQWPPVNNSQFESSTTSLTLSFLRHLNQTAAFYRSHGWPLYTGLTVVNSLIVIIQLMLPVYLCPKVITLSGFHCIS